MERLLATDCLSSGCTFVAKTRLDDLVGVLDPRRQDEVKRALGYALDWPELKILD